MAKSETMRLKIRGGEVTIDVADYELLSQFKWYYDRGYARMTVWDKDARVHRGIYLHQMLMGVRPGYTVDHADRNNENNSRSNLRWLTRSENWHNSRRADKFAANGRLSKPDVHARVTSQMV